MRPLILILLCFLTVPAYAATPDPTWVYEITGTTSLQWQPPTENVDGSPLTDLAGYNIYFGLSPGVYDQSINVADGAAQNWSFSWPVENSSQTNWYFAMTSLDSDDNESVYSNEILKIATITIVDTRPPKPPILDEVETQWNCIIRDAAGAVVDNVSCVIDVVDG